MLDQDVKSTNPFQMFESWLNEAKACTSVKEPTAMAVATVAADGTPSNRIVLCKDFSPNGFAFYTNYNSPKGADLQATGKAAAVFFWDPLGKQIRVRGEVKKTSRDASVHYWSTRPRESQLSQFVSQQSKPVADRRALEKLVEDAGRKFDGKSIPCPEHWGGFTLQPLEFEFWQSQPGRLHDRFLFTRPDPTNVHWDVRRLYP